MGGRRSKVARVGRLGRVNVSLVYVVYLSLIRTVTHEVIKGLSRALFCWAMCGSLRLESGFVHSFLSALVFRSSGHPFCANHIRCSTITNDGLWLYFEATWGTTSVHTTNDGPSCAHGPCTDMLLWNHSLPVTAKVHVFHRKCLTWTLQRDAAASIPTLNVLMRASD